MSDVKQKNSRIFRMTRAAACFFVLGIFLTVGLWIISKDSAFLFQFGTTPAEAEANINQIIPLRELALLPSRTCDKLLKKRYFPEDNLYLREDGQILVGSSPQDPDFALQNIEKLSKVCTESGKHFLYVILPGKPQDDNDLEMLGIPCARNRTADEMKSGLLERGIPCLDLREEFAGSDFYDYFYKTDHHWNAEAGLKAAYKLLDFINREFSGSFDLSVLERDRFHKLDTSVQWTGELGKRALGKLAGEDELLVLEPERSPVFRYRNLDYKVDCTGGFDVFLNENVLDGYSEEDGNAYYAYMYGNGMMETDNPEGNGNLLIIKDSFSNVMLPFRALSAGHITAWEMRTDSRVIEYINGHPEIDTVLVAYNISFVPTKRVNDFQ